MNGRHRYIALENTFVDHPKVLAVGPLAAYLYICGLCYCDRLQTDGHISAAATRMLLTHLGEANEANSVCLDLLASEGLWEPDENGGWIVHDYLKYQLSREAFASLAKKRADAGRKGGLASSKKRKQTAKQTASKPKQSNQEVDVDRDVDKDGEQDLEVQDLNQPTQHEANYEPPTPEMINNLIEQTAAGIKDIPW